MLVCHVKRYEGFFIMQSLVTLFNDRTLHSFHPFYFFSSSFIFICSRISYFFYSHHIFLCIPFFPFFHLPTQFTLLLFYSSLISTGNLVYVGSKASFIRSLMIGKVSEITGARHEPRYESIFLQGVCVRSVV